MTITNTVKVSTITVPLVAKISSRLPVCLNSNHDFNKTFVGGAGSTMNISIPDYGLTSVNTPALTDGQLSYVGASIPLSLLQYSKGIALTQQNMAVDFSNLKTQFADSYAQEFGSSIQRPVIDKLMYGGNSATVMSVAATNTAFNDLSYAIASVRQSRSAGEMVGAWSPILNSKFINAGIQYFNPTAQISDIFKNGAIGTFSEANCFTTPDFINYKWTQGLTVVGTLKGAITFSSGAATTVVFSTTTSAAGTIQKGSPFTIGGLNKTDIYGNDTGIPFVFVAQSACLFAADAGTCTVQPIYATGPNKNINTSTDVTATAVTWSLTTTKTYAIGSVYDKQTLCFGEANLPTIMGAESYSISDPEGITVTASMGPNITAGYGVIRMDNLSGAALARGIWAHNLYYQLD